MLSLTGHAYGGKTGRGGEQNAGKRCRNPIKAYSPSYSANEGTCRWSGFLASFFFLFSLFVLFLFLSFRVIFMNREFLQVLVRCEIFSNFIIDEDHSYHNMVRIETQVAMISLK